MRSDLDKDAADRLELTRYRIAVVLGMLCGPWIGALWPMSARWLLAMAPGDGLLLDWVLTSVWMGLPCTCFFVTFRISDTILRRLPPTPLAWVSEIASAWLHLSLPMGIALSLEAGAVQPLALPGDFVVGPAMPLAYAAWTAAIHYRHTGSVIGSARWAGFVGGCVLAALVVEGGVPILVPDSLASLRFLWADVWRPLVVVLASAVWALRGAQAPRRPDADA